MLQQRHHRCLSGSALTDNGRRLTLLEFQTQSLKDILTSAITERHILKSDIVDHLPRQFHLSTFILLSLQVHDLEQTVGCDIGILQLLVRRDQRL